jgi:hypothetical protein
VHTSYNSVVPSEADLVWRIALEIIDWHLSQSSIWCCFFSFSGNLNQLRRECNLINSIFSPFLLFFQYLLFVMYLNREQL